MCRNDIAKTPGFSAWCDFCPFVTDSQEEEALHMKDNPDHITHKVSFSYSINNKPNFIEPEERHVSKVFFLCVSCEKILENSQERTNHVLSNHFVTMITTTTKLGKVGELSEEEKKKLV